MAKPDHKKTQITYRIGMKRGKINYDERGKVTSHQLSHALSEIKAVNRIERFLWSQAPLFPAAVAYVLLSLFPVAAIVALGWLIAELWSLAPHI